MSFRSIKNWPIGYIERGISTFVVNKAVPDGLKPQFQQLAFILGRTARTYPTYLLFKPGMLLTSILLIRYWILNNRVFQKIENETSKNKYFLYHLICFLVFCDPICSQINKVIFV